MKSLRITRVAAVAAAALVVAALAACSSTQSSSPAGSTTSGGSIKIALIDPLTGTAAQYGQDLHQGQTLAIKQLNAAGGVLGKKFQAVEYDDQNLPAQGVTVTQRAISQDGVKFVVGTNGSSVALAIRNVTEKAKVIYIVGSSKGPTITDAQHHFVFRVNTSVDQDAGYFYPYVDKTLHPKKLAIIQEQSDSGQGLTAGIQAHFKDRALAPVITQLTTTDFGPFISKIQAQDPDAVFLADSGSTTAEAASVQQMKESGLDVPKVLGPGSVSAALLKLVGNGLDGAVTADVYAPSMDNKLNTAFVAAYRKAYKVDPSVQAELGYEQVTSLAAAIAKAKAAEDTTKVAAALRSITFNTPRGTVTFDAQGQAVPKNGLIPLTVKNGKEVPVK